MQEAQPTRVHVHGPLREAIGAKVRTLRRARRWTQVELAERLGLSQARLSEIERGQGSFSAEHLLVIFQLFNVGPSDFAPQPVQVASQLQNALARLGATHLVESERALPSAELREAASAVREVIIDPASPRLLTALAPVLVAQADRLNLPKLHAQLDEVGLGHRLAWVVDSTLAALKKFPTHSLPGPRARLYRRAETLLGAWLHGRKWPRAPGDDVLDRTVRTPSGLDELRASRSVQARRWGLVTALTVEDFRSALEQAYERD